jgi:hypothetical protein
MRETTVHIDEGNPQLGNDVTDAKRLISVSAVSDVFAFFVVGTAIRFGRLAGLLGRTGV